MSRSKGKAASKRAKKAHRALTARAQAAASAEINALLSAFTTKFVESVPDTTMDRPAEFMFRLHRYMMQVIPYETLCVGYGDHKHVGRPSIEPRWIFDVGGSTLSPLYPIPLVHNPTGPETIGPAGRRFRLTEGTLAVRDNIPGWIITTRIEMSERPPDKPGKQNPYDPVPVHFFQDIEAPDEAFVQMNEYMGTPNEGDHPETFIATRATPDDGRKAIIGDPVNGWSFGHRLGNGNLVEEIETKDPAEVQRILAVHFDIEFDLLSVVSKPVHEAKPALQVKDSQAEALSIKNDDDGDETTVVADAKQPKFAVHGIEHTQ
eukprot:jgi/Hompol1/727/HPOL_002567-RA